MRTYSYNVNGAQYDVTIESIQGQVAKLNVNGVSFDVEILSAALTEGDLPEVSAAAAPAAAPAAPAAAAPAAAPAAKGAAGAGTPVGMHPHVDEAPVLPYEALTSEHHLYDLVYNPLETRFLALGKAQGATTQNGLEMLHLQALAAWEMWQ